MNYDDQGGDLADGTITAYANFDGETNEKGQKHGFGKLTWDDGESFEGEFINDEKIQGKFKWSTGDVYEGEWKNDVMHGTGTYHYVDGRKYTGNWEGGCRHGKGTFTWPNGDQYDGEFILDQCQGVGIHTYADGKSYQGEWRDNKKHGYGTLIYAGGGGRTQGFWDQNLLSGLSIFTDDDESRRFLEIWKDGARIGARRPLKRTVDEMLQLLELNTMPTWANDSDHTSCFTCDEPFTFVNRRHHCRYCGMIFCDPCTKHKLKLLRSDSSGKPERVCDECFLLIKTSEVRKIMKDKGFLHK